MCEQSNVQNQSLFYVYYRVFLISPQCAERTHFFESCQKIEHCCTSSCVFPFVIMTILPSFLFIFFSTKGKKFDSLSGESNFQIVYSSLFYLWRLIFSYCKTASLINRRFSFGTLSGMAHSGPISEAPLSNA